MPTCFKIIEKHCKTIKVKDRSYKGERLNLSKMGLMDFEKKKTDMIEGDTFQDNTEE